MLAISAHKGLRQRLQYIACNRKVAAVGVGIEQPQRKQSGRRRHHPRCLWRPRLTVTLPFTVILFRQRVCGRIGAAPLSDPVGSRRILLDIGAYIYRTPFIGGGLPLLAST